MRTAPTGPTPRQQPRPRRPSSSASTDHITDSFTAVSSDGTASRVVTVTINGTNDVPVIGGVSIGSVTEDGLGGCCATPGNLTTSGALTITDVDNTINTFQANAAAGDNNYGSYTVDASGHWTYTLDN